MSILDAQTLDEVASTAEKATREYEAWLQRQNDSEKVNALCDALREIVAMFNEGRLPDAYTRGGTFAELLNQHLTLYAELNPNAIPGEGARFGKEWGRETRIARCVQVCTDAALREAAKQMPTMDTKPLTDFDLRRTPETAFAALSFANGLRRRIASRAGETEPESAQLTPAQSKVLRCIGKSNILLTGPDAYVDVGERTGKVCLQELESAGLVYRPRGARSGYALTDRGKQIFEANEKNQKRTIGAP